MRGWDIIGLLIANRDEILFEVEMSAEVEDMIVTVELGMSA